MNNQRVPVLLLTGYLGSGKTTLLNRILSVFLIKDVMILFNKQVKYGNSLYITKFLATTIAFGTIFSVSGKVNAASQGTLDFVTRCYEIALGREPEESAAGLAAQAQNRRAT